MRSLMVGAVATAIDLGTLTLLIEVLQVSPVAANIPALCCGLVAQFFGNKYLAFEDRTGRIGRQGAQFAGVEVGAFALNALAYYLLITIVALPFALARLAGSAVVYLTYSYPLWGRIFATAGNESSARS